MAQLPAYSGLERVPCARHYAEKAIPPPPAPNIPPDCDRQQNWVTENLPPALCAARRPKQPGLRAGYSQSIATVQLDHQSISSRVQIRVRHRLLQRPVWPPEIS